MPENHLTQDNPTGQIGDIDADALLNEIEGGGNRDIPMQQEQVEKPAVDPAPAAAVQEFEFEYKGQKIKAPITDPRIKTWLQQGYDYGQQTSALKKDREAWESERKQYDPYKRIDDFAKQNPDWWAEVERAYQARMQGARAMPGSPASPELEAIKQELEGIKQFKSDFEARQQQDRERQEDSALDKEVQSIRDQFKDLDWNKPDESGMTLEQRVIKHGMDMGLDGSKPGHFRAAFRDYKHDHLAKLAEERGKASQSKELQKRTRLGIIGTSPTPKKGLQPAEGIKNKSYNDLMREGLEELTSGAG